MGAVRLAAMITGMRAPGVVERIRAAQREDREWVRERPHLALADEVRRFVTASGIQWYHDRPLGVVLESLTRVRELAEGGTVLPPSDDDWAHGCLGVGLELATRGLDPAESEPDLIEGVWEQVVTLPPRLLLAREDPESHADLVLLNEARWRRAGLSTAYAAVSAIAAVGYFRPDDRWGVTATVLTLRPRFEDQYERRDAIIAEIDSTLAGFVEEYERWWSEVGR